MAFVPLATSTTLKTFRAMVRAQAGALDLGEHNDPMLNDFAHNAVVFVRNLARKFLDERYSTNTVVTETTNQIDISTVDISDTTRMSLYDGTHGSIPFVSSSQFDVLRTIYSATTLIDFMFARVANESMGADTKLVVHTYRGTNKATPGIVSLTYHRNPTRASSDSTKMDLPEEFIPTAVDVATVMLFRRINKEPPKDIENRVTGFVQAQMAQLGLKVTPYTS